MIGTKSGRKDLAVSNTSPMLGPPQTNRRHQQTLYTHPEDDDVRHSPSAFRHYSQPLLGDGQMQQPTVNRQHSYPADGSSYSARQSRDARSYTGLAEEQNETEDDTSSSSDEENSDSGVAQEVIFTQLSKEQTERLEWQIMLRSVLDGDVISSEKARVGIVEPESFEQS